MLSLFAIVCAQHIGSGGNCAHIQVARANCWGVTGRTSSRMCTTSMRISTHTCGCLIHARTHTQKKQRIGGNGTGFLLHWVCHQSCERARSCGPRVRSVLVCMQACMRAAAPGHRDSDDDDDDDTMRTRTQRRARDGQQRCTICHGAEE